VTALTILTDEPNGRTENAMTYPPPPGPGGSYPSDPYQAPQPYQPPQTYVPENPYGYDPNAAAYGYGSPYAQPQYPMPVTRPTDGMAIASLVVSCVSVMGLCTWGIGAVVGLVGAILGHVAQRRIRQTGANGGGMALAGIIVGWSVFVIGLIIAAVLIFTIIYAESNSPSGTY
jgi:hypothetical protein